MTVMIAVALISGMGEVAGSAAQRALQVVKPPESPAT